ncbi:heparan-alpha-glucosaminide N-acetyltransferase [Jiella sp. M17.18]|uniref:heparan-alpha-glucosaminide N-acetyltransferase n=1 Tax=Jiella sp. M17.18 TaxID=3234247 RepID=UPI0034DFC0A7
MTQTLIPVSPDASGAGPAAPNPAARGRIQIIDIARALALVAMVIFHFTWDLEHFSYVERGLTEVGGWRIFARCIATSFLFLVGFSLVLAHGRAIRWRPFLVRLAQIAAGAAAITLVTYFVTPNSFVFFGILHEIVVASLLGLLFVRLPFYLTGLVAAGVIALPFFVSGPAFDTRWLAWVGLGDAPPLSNDLVPIFPFFGGVLAGVAAARLATDTGFLGRLRALNPYLAPLWPAEVLGRHTLIFYLLHQPILFGLVWGLTQVAPPDLDRVFASQCMSACIGQRPEAFCQRYCACARDDLKAQNLFVTLMEGDVGKEDMTRIRQVTNLCSFKAQQ